MTTAPATTPAPAPSSTPSTTVETNIGPVEKDIMALFDHDPFAAPSEPTPAAPTEPAAQPQVTPEPAAPTPPAATPTAQPAQPAAPQAGVVPPELAALQARIDTLTQVVAQQPVGQPPATAAAAQPTQDDVSLPQHGYVFQVPDQLVAGLASDNAAERQQALGALIQGTATNVHREVIRAMRQELSQVLPQLMGRHIEQHQRRVEIFNDFYNSYPQFSNPVLRPLVAQVANQVATATGAREWSPQLKQAIAQHLANTLNGVQPQAAPIPPAPVPPTPPVITPGGVRPPAPDPEDSRQQMLDLLNF